VENLVLVANVLVLIAAMFGFLLLKHYLPSYFGKKAENLATKEDIGAITQEIEAVRHQYSAELEKLRAVAGARVNVDQARYGTELDILKNMASALVDLRDAVLSLRPAFDSYDSEEDEADRKQRRLGRYFEAARGAYEVYEKCRPFYPDDIYAEVQALDGVVWSEVVRYRAPRNEYDPDFDLKYWEQATSNAAEIRERVDRVLGLIRARVKYWEELDFPARVRP
jgi:hypothetical protein